MSHVIVCGLGHVGYRVTDLLLRLGETVTVITLETRDDWLRAVTARGAWVLVGDARDDHMLIDAGIERARALIACTGIDLANVEIALDARQLNPAMPVVARLFDQNLASEFEANFGLRRALAMSALSAPLFAAAALGERIVASFPVDDSLYVVGRLAIPGGSPVCGMPIDELEERYQVLLLSLDQPDERAPGMLPEQRPFAAGDRLTLVGRKESWDRVLRGAHGRAMATSKPGRRSVLHGIRRSARWSVLAEIWQHAPAGMRMALGALVGVLASSDLIFTWGMRLSPIDALYFVITTVTTVGYGDITPIHATAPLKLFACLLMLLGPAIMAVMYSIITDYVVRSRIQQLLGRQRTPSGGHAVVVGLGNLGYRTARELAHAGTEVVAIDRDASREFVETMRAHGTVIIGDARMIDTLTRAGIQTAESIVAATTDDAANLSVVLAAKRLNPSVRTVLRLFDAEFARKVEASLGVHAAMSASKLAAPTFAAASLFPGVRAAFVLDDRLFVVVEHGVEAEWEGKRPSRLRKHDGTLILRRARNGHHHASASGDEKLLPGESALAVLQLPLDDTQ